MSFSASRDRLSLGPTLLSRRLVTVVSFAQVIMWDGENKKRLQAPWGYPTSIAALAFSPTGAILAVASSYTFEEGEKDHPPDKVFFRPMSEIEVKPRPKTGL